MAKLEDSRSWMEHILGLHLHNEEWLCKTAESIVAEELRSVVLSDGAEHDRSYYAYHAGHVLSSWMEDMVDEGMPEGWLKLLFQEVLDFGDRQLWAAVAGGFIDERWEPQAELDDQDDQDDEEGGE